ncbi:MAG: tRNA glutamyl-Q synthetase [Chitinophagaceae bacterium]|nr:tRNA glutamyl-Q synthetase [Chitinophagaceae bacterium]
MLSLPNDRSFSLTRYAPTPSGFLHIGNILSFAITAHLADRYNAKVLLRIDDRDRERMELRYVQDIFDTLNFLDLPWQVGPQDIAQYEAEWSQVHRMPVYNALLQTLRQKGLVFGCTCSRADVWRQSPDGIYPGTCRHRNIPLDAPDVTWRLRTDDRLISVNTLTDSLVTEALPGDMKDFIVRKRDGMPAYQLTSVGDDVHFGVDLIVRGADLWHSTLAQVFLAQVAGYHSFAEATFHHHLLIEDGVGGKMSKSAGATSIQYMRAQGWSAADIWRELARLLGKDANVTTRQQLPPFI